MIFSKIRTRQLQFFFQIRFSMKELLDGAEIIIDRKM